MRTHRLSRTIGWLGAVCLLAGPLLAGCAGATPTPEPVTVTFAHVGAQGDYYQALALEFHKQHPAITVELQARTWQQMSNLRAGDVDVLVLNDPLGDPRQLGDILALDPWIEGSDSFNRSDYYPGTIDFYVREGKTWAIPAGANIQVMYYNRDLFDARGASYPQIGWTWDDFLVAATATSDPEAGVFGYGSATHSLSALAFIYQHGGRLLDDVENPTRATFDDPLTIEALEWYARLIHDYNVSPTPEQARAAYGGDDQRRLYYGLFAGKVAMWMDWFSERGGTNWDREWPMKWGMAPLPRDAQAATLLISEAYVISADAEHPEACWQWIDFLSHQTPPQLAPARRSVAESAEFERLAGADSAATVRASMEHVMLLTPQVLERYTTLGPILEQAMDEIVSGNATALQAMDWAQQEAEK